MLKVAGRSMAILCVRMCWLRRCVRMMKPVSLSRRLASREWPCFQARPGVRRSGVRVFRSRPQPREIVGVEIRPHTIGEIRLGERDFPQQKIAQPPFAPGANHQIDLRHLLCRSGCELRIARNCRSKSRRRNHLARPTNASRGRQDRLARRIVDGQPKCNACPAVAARPPDRRAQARR